jgi:hypothetical protein
MSPKSLIDLSTCLCFSSGSFVLFKVNPFVDPVLITCSSIYQYNKEDTWRCIAGLCERKKVLTNSQLAICE